MSVISSQGRQALIDYKYKSILKGWLDSNIMNDFWEKVVSFVPLNIAPNVITFTATAQFVISALIFSTYCTDCEKCAESWVYYMIAASLFIYQTLDAIDGKQARRTKQSSPLGQLFDHGNDALALTPMIVMGFCAMQLGKTWKFLVVDMMSYGVFFMLNWRARHVGMMHFGVFSVTESQLVGMGIFLFTGMFGCSIWNIDVFGICIISDLLIAFVCISSGLTMYGEYIAVREHYKNGQKRDPGQIYELLHLVLFVCGFMCWNLVDVFGDYPWTFIWIGGFVFCGIVHRLIVADVTHMNTTKYYHLLNPLLIMIFGSLFEYGTNVSKDKSVMNSPYMVYGILVYVLVFWSSYVLKVIDEICDTLKIRLFVITPPKQT
eukprot:440314_1